MYSFGPSRMAEQKQDDQLEHTFSSYVRIRDVALRTCQKWWTIGRSGERGSGISVLAARHDDDEDDCQVLFDFVHLCLTALSLSLSLSLSLCLHLFLYLSLSRLLVWSFLVSSRVVCTATTARLTFITSSFMTGHARTNSWSQRCRDV